jgi:LRR-repeat protein 1
LFGNVEQIHCRFVSEGKATITFKEPNISLIIQKADVNQLKSFLKIVNMTSKTTKITDDDIKLVAKSNKPVTTQDNIKAFTNTTNQLKRPTTTLIIKSKKEYLSNYRPVISQTLIYNSDPSQASQSTLLTNLVRLDINNCSLKSIDKSMLLLINLKYLDLSNNNFKVVETFQFPMLQELILVQNEIETINTNCFMPKLISLDISNNRLTAITQDFCSIFSNLSKLRINGNRLKYIENKFGYTMLNIKSLVANGNLLKSLPFSFCNLRLEMIELQSNPFEFDHNQIIDTKRKMITLTELSAKTIVNKKLLF